MKITKKIEAEILHVMDDYWSSYFKGDLETWASYLPNNYRNIGSTKEEIWNSKKEIIDYTLRMTDKMVGMAEIRNKKTQIIPFDPHIMVHELGEMYIKMEEVWTYYAPFRLSSLLEKTTDGWKVLHQHGSFPDTRAEEGDAFGVDEIKAENIKLREAIKRNTLQLEQKNRDLEIETALERIRAKTMAMQKSDELRTTSLLLFNELKALGEISNQISIGIFDEENQVLNLYATLHGKEWNESSKVDLDEPLVMQKIYGGWKQNKKSIQIDLKGDELKAYNRFRSKFSNLKFPDKRWVIHCAFFSKGVLSFSTTTPHDEQTMQLLERFAQVFDGTYTRFLDLQKAEAQARESKIETALEKVRSATMAMHHTSELQQVINIVGQQFASLNIENSGGVFICINDEIENEIIVWGSGATASYVQKVQVPFIDRPINTELVAQIKKGTGFYVEEFSNKEKVEFLSFLFKHPPYNKTSKEHQKKILAKKGGYTRSCAINMHTTLFMVSHDGHKFTTAENDVLQRFAKVFEQTYTRFLDLQKAEEQAREAQIEAALERVRAASMAMHKTDELANVVTVIAQQFQELGIDILLVYVGIYIYSLEEKYVDQWFSPLKGIKEEAFYIKLPSEPWENTTIKDWSEGKEMGYVSVYGAEAIMQYAQAVDAMANWNLFERMAKEMAIEIFEQTEANHKYGNLSIVQQRKATLAEIDILKRFAKVFEQTYTRFLDLQKAEAQTREAQIEAALERVRAQSMMMQHSDELNTTSNVFHEQLLLLGLPSEFSYVWLPDETNGTHMFWATWSEQANGEVTSRSKSYTYPLDKSEPYTAACFEMWESDDDVFVNRIQPEEVEGFFSTWSKLVGEAESLKAKNFPDGLYYAEAYMKYGCFGINIRRPLDGAEQEVLRRFANEFERTYTRFLDLQKAEEQARKIKLVNQENERLLHSILPQPIAEEIRTGRQNVVKRFEEVSILFADIVGFTELSEKLQPGKVVDILNGLFSKFDDLTDEYGLEKIKTIGDAYMVAAGVPEERADHASVLFHFALDMLQSLREYNEATGSDLNLRIGISSGPVIAGVIGKKKFAYDLWGDSVNTAARMEAYGQPGKIQISPTSYEILKNDFDFEKMPDVNIKGKGVMDVYLWQP